MPECQSELPVICEAERRQLLVEWNDTRRDYPKDRCIHELFETQVQKTPDAVAVQFDCNQLTYRELNTRANQLAHYLRGLGVRPEILVGVCMERSLEMIIGILGILKAGGAYVPLDPTYPTERLAFMLADAHLSVLLTQQSLVAKLPQHHGRLVCMDADAPMIDCSSQENPAGEVTAENLAYVIYTSGSTGVPKGVAIEHHSAVTLLHWAMDVFAREETRGVLASTSICFDLSVFEMFFPLSHGGKVILVENALHLSTLAAAADVTLINTVPSAVAELLRSADLPPSVDTICLAGEPLSPRLVEQIYEQRTVRQVFDLYGPSEDTTYSTFALRHSTGPATIGRPIANTQVYILDHHLQPVSIGVAGELFIGGEGLARGYRNRPEATAEKFLPNPFSNEPGHRLYRTGDSARYLPDGNIEFLGRIDNQVKIRGFRIELGEIETVLEQHSGVGQAVVLAWGDTSSDKQLVAYVVPSQALSPSTTKLRDFLTTKLPLYMVPSAFVFLEAIPLTPNGKIDRRALPAPDRVRPETVTFVPARNPIEEVVAGIWTEVLNLERIGVHDNFFELGGHSLLATRVISRLRRAFQRDFPLRLLFDAPTIASLAELIETTRRNEVSPQFVPPTQPISWHAHLPLSFAQQRLWVLDRLEPGNPTYNMPAAVRLAGGTLDISALDRSLNEIVRRHEALRTTFAIENGEPIQVTAPRLTIGMPVVDLQELPLDKRELRARQMMTEDAKRPFDLAQGPLLRAALLRLGPQHHILLVTMHHIVSDGWSMGVFFQELSVLYQAYASGEKSSLPELPIQYKDFAVWQRQWLQGKSLATQLSYWKQQLEAAPLLELPTDHPRSPAQTYRGARHSLPLSKPLSDALTRLSHQENVTLFMTLLAAFQILLQRYTGQSDITVGSPIAGRHQIEVEGLIGFFLNSLVLRTDLSDNPSFPDLLARVRQVALAAYTHQDLPFEKLLEELRPDRDLSRTPLFQVFFNMLEFEEDKALNLPGVAAELLEFDEPASNFDLTLYAGDRDGAIWLSLVYNSDLFEPTTISRLLGHFHTLLEAITANPQQRISSLPLFSEAERDQTRARRNPIAPVNSFIEFTKEDIEQSISARFEKLVNVNPNQVAVKTRNYRWTYAQLNRAANQIAQTILRSCDSGDERIALLFEHDAPMIAAILGVLKSGNAYVPLDLTHPKERLAHILEDSRATALLTTRNTAAVAKMLTTGPLNIIDIDEIDDAVSTANLDLPILPNALAYILYTSGSTGQPKGVMQNHRNVLHHIANYTNSLHLNFDDRLTLISSYGFDAAVMDMFGALLNGATLYPIDLKEEDPTTLLARMVGEKITIYHSTPTVYRYLFGSLTGKADLSAIRLAVIGGEEVLKKDVDLFRRHFSVNAIFVNGLGPTESTLALQYFINHDTQVIGNIVPVGYAVEDTEILLLNEAGEQTEIYGEIGIKSGHLALGYWQKPEITEAAFVPDPQGGTTRIYRTGDMGRLISDGTIAFTGRKDFQVKIRGVRIEPGEIEATLSQHPGVRECVVLAREDDLDEKRLVAYIVANQQASSVHDLRRFLKEKLPNYMVPSAFVYLDALPRTPNGKVDRRALPSPDQSVIGLEGRYVAPRSYAEEILVGIWEEVLKLERVGIHDNFFDLGGHSLLATRVISRLGKAIQIELPLRALFEAPTIAGLAKGVEESQRATQNITRLVVPVVSRDGDLPLSFAQERLWFLDQLEPGSTVYNLANGMRLKGTLRAAALEQSLNEIVRRHEALRTTFKSVEGSPRQVVTSGLTLALPVVDLSNLSAAEREAEAQRLADEENQRAFDLGRGPLLRAKLLRLGREDHVLLLNMHHIVSDGWSMGVLFRELSVLYEAFRKGERAPLADLPVQYADYAVWQREWLQGEVLETQLSYWKTQLANITALQLATDRPRPAVQAFRGARQSLVLSEDLTDKLKVLSRKEEITLFMALLAAFQILLHRITGQDDIVVGSPIAGRTRSEIEGLIGFFLNSLVLRTDLSGNPTFKEVLVRVRQVALGAYEHQDVPFEKLLEELRPERDLSRTPLFQVFFNMLNVGGPMVELSGLKIETLSHSEVESKFDLTIYVREHNRALHFNLIYNADLFDADRMAEVLQQYQALLSQVVEDPDQRIRSYSLLTKTAQRVLPNPVEPLGADWFGSVHARFSHQAKRQPDQLAITDPFDSWTYEELNSRSNQLAHYLLQSGIRREDIVAVYGHRSASLAWALLGILKAGAAFLILDPAYPTARIIEYLDASKPRGFVQIQASRAVANELEDVLQATVRCRVALPRLSELGNFLEGGSTVDPKIDVGPNDLAYVSYTSGSTGEPKGVLGRHGPLSHFLPWQAEKFDLMSSDHFSLLSGLSHDPLHREIFTALWVGGTICVPDPDILGASSQLADWMAGQRITFAHLTPPLGRLLTETAKPESQLPSLRYVFLVGDKLTWADVARLRKLAPQVACINYYGSTETQRAVSYYEIAANENNTSSQGVVPVGRGMPNVQLLVLNNDQKLAGLGEVGEIYMRSPHLARGYQNDNFLTEARFIRNPFTKQVGDSLYRTGDIGRYLRDGSVEVLGRTDRQVKIRGFRIELGEIEAILSSHSDIRDAVVLVREDKAGEICLIAYAVSQLNKKLASHELRTFLKKKLPDYMIPSVIMMLDALPLTPNGKIDTRALPGPEVSIELQETFVPPGTPVEEALTRIWAEVLSTDKVGVRHNFFELGGHSLLATKVMSRIPGSFHVELALRTLFEKPTVEELAVAITEKQAETKQKEQQVSSILAELESLSEEEAQSRLLEEVKLVEEQEEFVRRGINAQ
jgi:amino acid adenylation domain-containing protein